MYIHNFLPISLICSDIHLRNSREKKREPRQHSTKDQYIRRNEEQKKKKRIKMMRHKKVMYLFISVQWTFTDVPFFSLTFNIIFTNYYDNGLKRYANGILYYLHREFHSFSLSPLLFFGSILPFLFSFNNFVLKQQNSTQFF